MTFAVLRALHAIIGEALDEIEAVYAMHTPRDTTMENDNGNSPITNVLTPISPNQHIPPPPSLPGHRSNASANSLSNIYASPPPSPCIKTELPSPTETLNQSSPALDFPALDLPCDPSSLSEALTQHPDVVNAVNRIIAACGQMTTTVQTPFLTICDAVMAYHLPSCMRLFEASNTVEILREAGPGGLHVGLISMKNGVEKVKLAHTLRLLATHHIVREVSPNVFTLNRISSTMDTGKSINDLQRYATEGVPEKKYEDTTGISAFVGLCADEIFKSSAYLTETYLLSNSDVTRAGSEPTRAPFCFAFDTVKSRTDFFGWLEGTIESNSNHTYHDEMKSVEIGRGARYTPVKTEPRNTASIKRLSAEPSLAKDNPNSNRFRLVRFGKAMSGTGSWETPGAILNGFDWHSLPRNSIVVDVGGGIGSASMLLASAFSTRTDDDDGLGLRFIVQDRPTVVEMGEKAWRTKCPEFLDNGTAQFQVHDFFTPQPVKQAAIFLLRVVLHDWPDDFARRILLQLREASTPATKLLLADFILPLACPEESCEDGILGGIQGMDNTLSPSPLLPNLGKANANAYWMDLTMQVVFNAKERTLREIVELAALAGWKVVKVTKCNGSCFGYIVAVPTVIPSQVPHAPSVASSCRESGFPSTINNSKNATMSEELKAGCDYEYAVAMSEHEFRYLQDKDEEREVEMALIKRSSSRCGTPTFGSRLELSLVEEALSRFGGGIRTRSLGMRTATRSGTGTRMGSCMGLGNAIPPPLPPKPSALKQAITLLPPSLTGSRKKKPSPLTVASNTCIAGSSKPPSASSVVSSPGNKPTQASRPKTITRRVSLANLRMPVGNPSEPPPPLPNVNQNGSARFPPSPLSPKSPVLARRASHVQLSQNSRSSGSLIPVRQSVPVESNSVLGATPGSGYGEKGIPFGYASIRRREDEERMDQVIGSLSVKRRSSLAQLRVPSSPTSNGQRNGSSVLGRAEARKRTKSAVGIGLTQAYSPPHQVVTSPIAMNKTGGAYSKNKNDRRQNGTACVETADTVSGGVLGNRNEHVEEECYEPVNVLAAAARFERGLVTRKESGTP